MKQILVFIIPILSITASYADDTAFGGSGSSPMPIEKTDIAMVNERVHIEGNQIDKENMQGEWKVSCDFTFQNTTDKPLTLNVGFPFPIYESEGNVTAPAGKKIHEGDALVHDFSVKIDGKPIAATKQKIQSNPEKGLNYSDAYIWQMHFSPHQLIKVHHNYITGVTFNVMGHSMVSYVLKTGGLWQNGTIGEAMLEIMPNTPTRLCNELTPKADEYLKPHPEGIKIIGTGRDRKYVWKLINFQPKNDVDVCLQTGKNYVRYQIVYPLVNNLGENKIALKNMNANELRILRNTIYAQYGRRFTDANLQAYFNKQWWYEQNPNYSDQLLTKEDRQALGLIAKEETQKGH